jgi:hypothetical protein
VHAKLGEDARDVVALGARGDVEARGDLLGGKTLSEQLQHLAFSRRQLREGREIFALTVLIAASEAQEPADLVEWQECVAQMQPAYRLDQLIQRRRLGQDRRGTTFDGAPAWCSKKLARASRTAA